MSIKQVIVVRADLKMRRGKESAQVAHASMKVFLDRGDILERTYDSPYRDRLVVNLTESMRYWIENKFTKIVLTAISEEELLEIYDIAVEAKVPCSLIQDEGLTEFGGVKTYTTVAIGPADSSLIDNITGHLKLR